MVNKKIAAISRIDSTPYIPTPVGIEYTSCSGHTGCRLNTDSSPKIITDAAAYCATADSERSARRHNIDAATVCILALLRGITIYNTVYDRTTAPIQNGDPATSKRNIAADYAAIDDRMASSIDPNTTTINSCSDTITGNSTMRNIWCGPATAPYSAPKSSSIPDDIAI
jgi:hypothetical protein